MNKGKISQIIGPVLDLEFEEGKLPAIFNAINIALPDGKKLVAEVQQHLGENIVRSVAMDSTDGLVRGMEVVDTVDYSVKAFIFGIPHHAYDTSEAGCIARAVCLGQVCLAGVKFPNTGMAFELRTWIETLSIRYSRGAKLFHVLTSVGW